MKTTENRSEECSVKKNVFNVDRQFMLSIPFVKIHPAIYQEFQVGSGLLFVFHFELLLKYVGFDTAAGEHAAYSTNEAYNDFTFHHSDGIRLTLPIALRLARRLKTS